MSKKLTIDSLIEALQIAKKYASDYNMEWPTHCEHDELWLCIDAEQVSEEDKKRLDELSFFEDDGGFKSFHFGSC